MSSADRFSILLSVLTLMTGILSMMLRFLWKLSGLLSNLTTRIENLEKAQPIRPAPLGPKHTKRGR